MGFFFFSKILTQIDATEAGFSIWHSIKDKRDCYFVEMLLCRNVQGDMTQDILYLYIFQVYEFREA